MGFIRIALGYAVKRVLADRATREKALRVAKKGVIKVHDLRKEGEIAKNLGKSFVKIKKRIIDK